MASPARPGGTSKPTRLISALVMINKLGDRVVKAPF